VENEPSVAVAPTDQQCIKQHVVIVVKNVKFLSAQQAPSPCTVEIVLLNREVLIPEQQMKIIHHDMGMLNELSMMPSVIIVKNVAKFHFSQLQEGQYSVVIVLKPMDRLRENQDLHQILDQRDKQNNLIIRNSLTC